MERLEIPEGGRLLVLTGAGVSAESGVPTFRGADGLWENHPIEAVASPEGFRSDPKLVWRFYSERRAKVGTVHPNAGHRALAAIEQQLGERFLLATQNVDGLHARAGSRRVVEMHGNLLRTRCSVCDLTPFEDDRQYPDALPECPACKETGARSLLRPAIVWFGEMLDPADLHRIDDFIAQAGRRLVFLAVGTSGVVYPAAGLVQVARRAGAATWLVNLEVPDNVAGFDHVLKGPSGEILPALLSISLDLA
jgi:NAD-dependent deacetylase